MDEEEASDTSQADLVASINALGLEGRDANTISSEQQAVTGAIVNLDGEPAGDEFLQDAMNYRILLGKIDSLLEMLDLDA